MLFGTPWRTCIVGDTFMDYIEDMHCLSGMLAGEMHRVWQQILHCTPNIVKGFRENTTRHAVMNMVAVWTGFMGGGGAPHLMAAAARFFSSAFSATRSATTSSPT